MRFEVEGRRLNADFAQPLSIAIPLDFNGPQPSFYNAPAATAKPYREAGFVGDTRAGGSCNCEQLTLVPHCNGTHTECVGHVTDDRVAITDRLRGGIVLALLVSVHPVAAVSTGEDSDPPPAATDLLVTAESLAVAFAAHPGPAPRALGAAHAAHPCRTADPGLSRKRPRPLPVEAGGVVAGRSRHRASGAGPAFGGSRGRPGAPDRASAVLRTAAPADGTRAMPAGHRPASPNSPGSRRRSTTAGTCSTCRFRHSSRTPRRAGPCSTRCISSEQ